MKILDLDQAGPQWLEWRRGGIGGSDAPVLRGDVKWTSRDQLFEAKAGRYKVEENDRMRRGKELEPVARALYIEETGIVVKPACIVHDIYPWLRASLDGLSEDRTHIIEIKCPSDWAHTQAVRGYWPKYYTAQLYHSLLAAGVKSMHYVSYTDSPLFAKKDRLKIVPVPYDEDLLAELLAEEAAAWEEIQAYLALGLKTPHA